MTSYGPPGQPPGPPPPPSQPPGSYRPPAGGGAAKFDPKTVNPLDWGILAAAVLAVIFSFFKYYSYKANLDKLADAFGVPRASVHAVCSNLSQVPPSQRGAAEAGCNGADASAWHGFFGWFGVILALVGAALIALAIFAPQMKLPFAARLGALAAFALAVISTLIALPVVPNYSVDTAQLSGTGVSYDDVVDEGHSFSYWIVLILLVVGLVLTFLRFQQSGGQLAAWRGSTNALGSPGGRPPGFGVQGPQQPTYGSPTPESPAGGPPGYGAPPPPGAAPQPGYVTPPQPPPPMPPSAPPPPPPPQ